MRSSLMTNAVSDTSAMKKKVVISRLSNQSLAPPSSRKYCREPMPVTSRRMPHQSIFPGFTEPGRFVTKFQDRNAAAIPIGRLIKNIQCQERLSVMNPPSTGPNVGPRMTPRPKMARPVLAFSGGKAPMIMDCAVDKRPPPPNPWMKRQHTMDHSPVDSPQKRDAQVKMATE